MKKIPIFLMITITGLIPVLLFYFMCLNINHTAVLAQDGFLDLKGQLNDREIVALNSQWEFYYGALLTPEELNEKPLNYELTDVPATWYLAGYPAAGYGTFRLTIETEQQELLLYIPELKGGSALWVNGELAHQSGRPAESRQEEEIIFSNKLLNVIPENQMLELVVQVSNHRLMGGGLTSTLKIGKTDAMLFYFLRTRGLYIFVLGAVFFMALYHLGLYVFRRQELMHLLFSLLCLSFLGRFLFESNGLNHFFQFLPFTMTTLRLSMVLFLMHTLLISYYTLLVFKESFTLRQKKLYAGYALIAMAFYLVTPLDNMTISSLIAFLCSALMIYAVILGLRSKKLRKNPWTAFYLVSIVLNLTLGTAGNLFLNRHIYMVALIPNLFILLAQSLNLSRNYAEAFEMVEKTNENLENRVMERTMALRDTNEAMKSLITNISHDLKTPLTILSINLEKLQELTAHEALYSQYLNIAWQKNLDLKRLMGNLIEVSRIEAGNLVFDMIWIPLAELLSQVQDKYGEFLENEDIYFEITYRQSPQVLVDISKIWSIFDNVIYNAHRHTEKGGSIVVSAQMQEKSVVTEISDTGCGIEQEHLPHIFERFYKGSQNRDGNHGESGLGLYIVKTIAEGMGQKIWAESVPGKGTSVFFTLEAKQPE